METSISILTHDSYAYIDVFVLIFIPSASLLKVLTRYDLYQKLETERICSLVQYSVYAKKKKGNAK